MAEVVMFKKPQNRVPGASGKSDAKDRASESEVVVFPGLDVQALSQAWAYWKKTGRTHKKPARSGRDD